MSPAHLREEQCCSIYSSLVGVAGRLGIKTLHYNSGGGKYHEVLLRTLDAPINMNHKQRQRRTTEISSITKESLKPEEQGLTPTTQVIHNVLHSASAAASAVLERMDVRFKPINLQTALACLSPNFWVKNGVHLYFAGRICILGFVGQSAAAIICYPDGESKLETLERVQVARKHVNCLAKR